MSRKWGLLFLLSSYYSQERGGKYMMFVLEDTRKLIWELLTYNSVPFILVNTEQICKSLFYNNKGILYMSICY